MININSFNTLLSRFVLVVVGLFYYMLSAGYSYAKQPLLGDTTDKDEPRSFMSFVDEYHSFLVGRINEPAVWFDNFFGEERSDDDDLPTSFVRLSVSSKFTEGDGFEFPVRIRANIKLPQASNKLRLIVVGENDDELFFDGTGKNDAPVASDLLNEEKSTVGLRYTFYKTIRSKLHFGGGTHNFSPFEYYVRTNYKRFVHVDSKYVVIYNQTGFWDSIDGLGETSQLGVERLFSNQTAVRMTLSGTYYDSDPDTEDNNGLNWSVGSSYFRHLSSKTASSFDLGVYGVTRPVSEITNYRVAFRLRSNLLRPWLFFEVEPEVTFPLPETGGRQIVGAISLLVEIQITSF